MKAVFATVLTLVTLAFVVWLGTGMFDFLIRDAVWSGVDRAACTVGPQHPRVGAHRRHARRDQESRRH